jgi:hypothetical protein
MDDFLKFHPTYDKFAKNYSKQLFGKIDDLKSLLKSEKGKLRNNEEDYNRELKKIIVKIAKVFRNITDNGRLKNWIREEMTEAEFTTRFITPIIDLKPDEKN